MDLKLEPKKKTGVRIFGCAGTSENSFDGFGYAIQVFERKRGGADVAFHSVISL